MGSNLDPGPYLQWTNPYHRENIAFSLRRLQISDRVRVLCADDTAVGLGAEKRMVLIVEAPRGAWGVWVSSESSLQCALCSGDDQAVRDAQKKRVCDVLPGAGSKKLKDLKVPFCEVNHSGPASVCNALWLAPARRRGHPTGSAYMQIRDSDTQAWLCLGNEADNTL